MISSPTSGIMRKPTVSGSQIATLGTVGTVDRSGSAPSGWLRPRIDPFRPLFAYLSLMQVRWTDQTGRIRAKSGHFPPILPLFENNSQYQGRRIARLLVRLPGPMVGVSTWGKRFRPVLEASPSLEEQSPYLITRLKNCYSIHHPALPQTKPV